MHSAAIFDLYSSGWIYRLKNRIVKDHEDLEPSYTRLETILYTVRNVLADFVVQYVTYDANAKLYVT